MSSIGLGRSPVIYPTPLNTDSSEKAGNGGNTNSYNSVSSANSNINSNRGYTSGFTNASSKVLSPVLTRSSPLITKYTKRRLKKVKKLHGTSTTSLSNEYMNIGQGLNSIRSSQENLMSKKKNPIYIKDTKEYKLHLVRKVFLPKLPMNNSIQDYLPALTSSSQVDIELYCFFGLIFKNFISSWYSRISDNDEFTLEIIDILAHLTRNLETRFRKLNLSDLLLDDIPYILNNHREFYLYCVNNLNSQYIQCNDMNEAFELLNNHPALSKKFKEDTIYCDKTLNEYDCYKINHTSKYKLDAREDSKYKGNPRDNAIDDESHEAGIGILNDSLFMDEHFKIYSKEGEKAVLEENYLFMLSKGILALILPIDLSDCNLVKFFLRSIFANIVLRSIVKNLSDPDILYKILISIFSKMNKKNDSQNKQETQKKKGNVNEDSANISINSMIQLPKTIKWRIIELFRKISHFIAYSTNSASMTTSKNDKDEDGFEDDDFDKNNYDDKDRKNSTSRYERDFLTNPDTPIVDRFFVRFLNNLFNFSIENPVLYCVMKYFGLWFLSYNIEEIKLQSRKNKNGNNDNQKLNSLINRNLFSIKINQIIYNLINKLIILKFLKNESFISSMIQTFRHLLFPNDDTMGPPRKVPSLEELQDIKIELFKLMKSNIPGWFKLFVFNEMPNKSYYFFTNKMGNPDGTQLNGNDAGDIFINENNMGDEENEASSANSESKAKNTGANITSDESTNSSTNDRTNTENNNYASFRFRSMVKTKTDYKLYLFIESLKDKDFNKLLIYNILDHLLIELFPEMANLTPSELEKH